MVAPPSPLWGCPTFLPTPKKTWGCHKNGAFLRQTVFDRSVSLLCGLCASVVKLFYQGVIVIV